MEALPVFILIVFIATLCLAAGLLEHHTYKAKRAARTEARARAEARLQSADAFDPLARWVSPPPGTPVAEPIRQGFAPVSQYKDYQPAGHTSQPVSSLAAAVWQAHVDAQNLDAQILTGSALEIAAAMGRVRKSSSHLMREMTQEFEDTL